MAWSSQNGFSHVPLSHLVEDNAEFQVQMFCYRDNSYDVPVDGSRPCEHWCSCWLSTPRVSVFSQRGRKMLLIFLLQFLSCQKTEHIIAGQGRREGMDIPRTVSARG